MPYILKSAMLQSGRRAFLLALAAMMLGACGPSPLDENKRLSAELEKTKKELEELRTGKPADQLMRDANESFAKGDYSKAKLTCERLIANSPESPVARDAAALLSKIQEKLTQAPTTPELDLTINELWTQRSEDNRYRAKQRLDAKLMRVTGSVEDISERSCSITGARSPIGPVNLTVNLSDSYAIKIQAGLVFVERGTQVSAQGRFSFDKMSLSDAVFVDRSTGRILLSDDLKELSRAGDPTLRPAVKKSAEKPE